MKITEIRNIVLGRKTSTRTQRKTAISLLLNSNYPKKHKDFELLLKNRKEPSWVRHIAAVSLSNTINNVEARRILVNNLLHVTDEFVLAGIIASLGRIGDKQSLEAILKIRKKLKGLALMRSKFALSLISYRLGLKGHELPIPNEGDYLHISGDSQKIEITKAAEEQIKKCFQSITNSPFGIQLARKLAYQLQLGNDSYLLILNREFLVLQGIKKLLRKKAVLGIIATDKEINQYSVSYLILTSPAKKKRMMIDILVVRAYGKLCLAGTATLKPDQIKFSIHSLSQPGIFPAIVEGIFEHNELKISTSEFSPNIKIQNEAIEMKL